MYRGTLVACVILKGFAYLRTHIHILCLVLVYFFQQQSWGHALQSEGIDSTFLAKDALREEDIIQHLKSLTEEKLTLGQNI